MEIQHDRREVFGSAYEEVSACARVKQMSTVTSWKVLQPTLIRIAHS